jgi:hypothetical protein
MENGHMRGEKPTAYGHLTEQTYGVRHTGKTIDSYHQNVKSV